MIRPELVIAPDIQIEPLKPTDVEGLLSILREDVRDRDTGEVIESDIQKIQGFMRGEKDEHGRVRKYLVARGDDDRVYGCMAYSSPPDPDIVSLFKSDPIHSAQLLDVFVPDPDVASKLLNRLCIQAAKEGKRQLWIASNLRYESYWVFFEKMCGRPKGFFWRSGEQGHTEIWLKSLDYETYGPGSDYHRFLSLSPDYWKYMSPDEYREKINTPARNPEYFRRFHQPIIERAKQQFGPQIRLLDIACGPGDELDFVKNDP